MARLARPEDLKADALEEILRHHLGDRNLKVVSVNGNQTFLSKNDNFNSEIKKWTIVVEQGGE
jgi:hypothetical protein